MSLITAQKQALAVKPCGLNGNLITVLLYGVYSILESERSLQALHEYISP